MDKRIDHLTALLVDAAINASDVHGMAAATDELVRHGLPLQVVQRVLIMHAKRRCRRGLAVTSLAAAESTPLNRGRRRNWRLAALIEVALIISKVHTVRQGERVLIRHRVPPDLIRRVLYEGRHMRRIRRPASKVSLSE